MQLLMPGYPAGDADQLLAILSASGQPAHLNSFPEPLSAVDAAKKVRVDVAVIHLDHLAATSDDVIRWLKEHHSQAEIILATRAPAEHFDLAEEAGIPDLIDSRDHVRIALAIRRSYRRILSRRDPPPLQKPEVYDQSKPDRGRTGEDEKGPLAATPAPQAQRKAHQKLSRQWSLDAADGEIAPPASGRGEIRELLAILRPLVSLDGDTRAHYLLYPGLVPESGHPIEQDGSIVRIPRADPSPETDAWLVESAAEMLARLADKAGLHLGISEQSLENESILMRTCESLRRYNVRASNLYFDFDAALLRTHNHRFLQFLSKLRKINCRITCSNLEYNQKLPELLSRYGVHMAQYAESTMELALSRASDARKLARINRDIQRRGIKTLAGNIDVAERLALLWQLGVNYGWGDFLHTPDELGTAKAAVPHRT